jgi:hypothetical protein
MTEDNKKDLTEKQKKSLIDYMIKYHGYTEFNARRRFEPWESRRIDNRGKSKRTFKENKRMTKEQLKSVILYMYEHGYITSWIAKCIGISENTVLLILHEND